MDTSLIMKEIEAALNLVYRVDGQLIDSQAHEQAISARIMIHLQHLLPEWDVDVEYNRQGGEQDPKRDVNGDNRRPDIIVHKRGPAGPNLAVISVKCEWNNQDRGQDVQILRGIKSAQGYQSAFCIEIRGSDYTVTEK